MKQSVLPIHSDALRTVATKVAVGQVHVVLAISDETIEAHSSHELVLAWK